MRGTWYSTRRRSYRTSPSPLRAASAVAASCHDSGVPLIVLTLCYEFILCLQLDKCCLEFFSEIILFLCACYSSCICTLIHLFLFLLCGEARRGGALFFPLGKRALRFATAHSD